MGFIENTYTIDSFLQIGTKPIWRVDAIISDGPGLPFNLCGYHLGNYDPHIVAAAYSTKGLKK